LTENKEDRDRARDSEHPPLSLSLSLNSNAPADLILANARVYTADEANPSASAVVTKGNQIVYVGDEAGAKAWQGPQTRVVDAGGRSLLPGFIDSHFHLMHGAIALGGIQLNEVRTLLELETAVRSFARDNPDLPWLEGQGLRYDVRGAEGPLTRWHLDAIERERPLVLFSYDVHTAWANTAALEAAGMLHAGHDPATGVMPGADGLPAGELREESAYGGLLAQIPPPDDARRRRLVGQALAWLASLGITSVHNMDGDAQQAAFYAALEDLGELTLRVYMPYTVRPETPLEALAQEAAPMREQFQSDMLRAGAVKFFMDGVYESYTAVTLDGYPGQPHDFGFPLFDTGHFARMAGEADRLGLQIFVHACGDGAVRRVLDGYETAREQNGVRDSRHRVEHIEMIDPDDAVRLAHMGAIASMQPLHAPDEVNDADVWPSRVREEEWGRAFAWRMLRDAGATIAFGSDWPVAPPDPIAGIAAAVNRQPWRPGLPRQKQTLAEAIAGYTRDAAYAEFQEDKKGQIKVGMLADMVLLSDNIFAAPAEELAMVRVTMTICDGRVVFER
jgi:predicted amidohydrolase YtcJ